MRCSACHSRFSAAWAQPSPGGSSAPGLFLVGALIFTAITATTLLLKVAYVPWICLAIALFVAIQVPIAWSDCRSRSGLSTHGGGTCPNCGSENPVRFWSF